MNPQFSMVLESARKLQILCEMGRYHYQEIVLDFAAEKPGRTLVFSTIVEKSRYFLLRWNQEETDQISDWRTETKT